MPKLIIFNKPFKVLSQFTDQDKNRATLKDHISEIDCCPAGRLDYDSEGLLLLTNDGPLQHQLSHPKHKEAKVYWVQVEGDITAEAVQLLAQGLILKDGPTRPCKTKIIQEPNIWPRNPAVRFRANIPTSWLEITLTEGRNRQVRRMTAAVGFPTLRLIRYAIGEHNIDTLEPGQYKTTTVAPASYKPNNNKDNPLRPKRRPQRHSPGKQTRSQRFKKR